MWSLYFMLFVLFRLAKKESDREKLAAEFPLLFNNKTVGNKVTNTTLALNKTATVVTPGKRKSTFSDKNNENCSSAANKIASNPVLGSKTPLSSKKQRKGSLLLSPKPQSHQLACLSKTLPCFPTYKAPTSISASTPATPASAAAPVMQAEPAVEQQAVVMTEDNTITEQEQQEEEQRAPSNSCPSPCSSSATTAPALCPCPESCMKPAGAQAGLEGVELTTFTGNVGSKKTLFADSELEHCTSTSSGRSSLSSLGASVAPPLYCEEPVEEVSTGRLWICCLWWIRQYFYSSLSVTYHILCTQQMVVDPAASSTTSGQDEGVAEAVQDVLDYLLELDELDEQTYRRVSSTSFTAKTIKRLSMSMSLSVDVPATGGRPSAPSTPSGRRSTLMQTEDDEGMVG